MKTPGVSESDFVTLGSLAPNLLDHLIEGCQLISTDWRYLYVNESAAIQGLQTRAALIGRTMEEAYPGIEKTPMFTELERCMRERTRTCMENEFVFPDGSHGWFELRFEPVPGGVFIFSQDISERKRAENELKTMVKVLELINSSETRDELLKAILHFLQNWSRCEAIGIRLKEGSDYPYFLTSGFSDSFVKQEMHLCTYNHTGGAICDSEGIPLLECMCGNILQERCDPAKNFFTSDGCFWSNCTSELLATTTDAERQARTRNRCNGEGYESVALIPLRSGNNTFGLIQLNDKHKNCFTADMITICRRIADHVAVFLAKKQAEEALHKSEYRFRLMAETINDVFWLCTRAIDKMIYVSPGYEKLWERSTESLYKSPQSFIDPIHPDDRAMLMTSLKQFHQAGQPYEVEFRIVKGSGEIRWVCARGFPVSDAKGAENLMTGLCTDITEDKHAESEKNRLEEQFHQAQKLESIGQLAGGVAHDFNNILSVQLGYCELMLEELKEEDPFAQNLLQIKICAERAAVLTRQLLAFSRKQALQPVVLDLNDVVANIEKMLRRLIGEDIDFIMVLREDLGRVKVDPGQIEQVIMNLAVNSRDAMPDGGKLTLETANVVLDEEYARKHVDAIAGPHVMLAVTDTGCGMDEATKLRLFEPFFTTKGPGKGTGLGLATVYGIVRQSGGTIWVYSELGRGTTIKIYLPLINAEAESINRQEIESVQGNGELILVVEDESGLRKLFAQMIEKLGYRVFAAGNGGEALIAVEEEKLRPDLLITDVVMPGIGGKVLAERLTRTNQNLKVLYISGYTANAIVHHGVLDANLAFLQKPFNKNELAAKIREVLGK